MKKIIITMLIVMLSACASTSKTSSDKALYLRADFTYWEAREEFKFKLNEESQIKYLTTNIKYDGNPYSFLIADKGWSENSNCGFTQTKFQRIKQAVWIPLNCSYDKEKNIATPILKPFKFNPKRNGKFQFEIKLDGQGKPAYLRVSEIKSAKG